MMDQSDEEVQISIDLDVLLDRLRQTDGVQQHYSRSLIVLRAPVEQELDIQVGTVAGDHSTANEDAVGMQIGDSALILGVFDGTTSLRSIAGLEEQNIRGARFASQALSLGISSAEISMHPRDLLAALNVALAHATLSLTGVDPANTNTFPASSATIVKCDVARGVLEVASVYDSWCVVYRGTEDAPSSELLTDDCNRQFDKPVLDLIRSVARERGMTPREARQDERVEHALLASRIVKNNTPDGSGCGIVNGDPAMTRYIQTQSLPLAGVQAVLLGTDGLLPLGWLIEDERDRERLFHEIRAGGFEQLIALKKHTEDADPDWQQVRFKHSDDATGVLVVLKPLPT